MFSSRKTLLISAAPLLLLVIFFILPIVSIIVLSFWRTESYQLIADFTVSNYITIFTEGAYLTFLLRSLVVASIISLICVVLAWPISYGIVLYGGRYKLLLVLAFAVPFLTGEVLRVIALQGVLGPVGLLNGTLMHLGMRPIRFIMYTQFSTGIGLVYLYLPFVVTVVYLSLLTFDFRLVDAAKTFGASPMRAFFEVTWPLNLFGTIVGFALCFIPSLSVAIAPRFLGGPNGALYGMAIGQQFGDTGTWSLGAAMGVVLFVITTVVVMVGARFVNLRRTGFSAN